MRVTKIFVIILLLTIFCTPVMVSAKGKVAGKEDIALLKKDILNGRIKIGKTRLKTIKDIYGDADNISETEAKITYDYGDLRLEFDKNRYMRNWGYDYSRKTQYSDEIEDLRFDLQDGQIVGDYVSYDEIVGDYEAPTEAMEKDGYGELSYYYYCEIRLTFENVYTVRSWRGQKLKQAGEMSGELRDGSLSTTGDNSSGSGGIY